MGRHSNPKQWMRRFLSVFGVGWEFSNLKAMHQEFPIRASRNKVPDDKGLTVALEPLSERVQSCVDMVYTWVIDHEDVLWIEALLTPANIDDFW